MSVWFTDTICTSYVTRKDSSSDTFQICLVSSVCNNYCTPASRAILPMKCFLLMHCGLLRLLRMWYLPVLQCIFPVWFKNQTFTALDTIFLVICLTSKGTLVKLSLQDESHVCQRLSELWWTDNIRQPVKFVILKHFFCSKLWWLLEARCCIPLGLLLQQNFYLRIQKSDPIKGHLECAEEWIISSFPHKLVS